MTKTTQAIIYPPHIQKKIEQAIIFLVRKIEQYCLNEKPLVLHSLRVGLRLMDLKQGEDVVMAGFLHDLVEDTNCKLVEIEKEFGEKVAGLVSACTFDKNIEDYKERWKKLISNLKQIGRDAIIIKLIDQMDNLPYYILISDDEKKQEVMWKHKFFIAECRNDLAGLQIFKDYEEMVKGCHN